jgi:hypothetical protein
MSNKKFNLFICLIFLFAILPLISSIPPVQTTITDNGLQIAYPQYQYVPINANFTLLIHVYNTSQYFTGSQATCYLDLYSSNGSELMNGLMNAVGSDYSIPITSANFSTVGYRSFVIQCNSTTQVGFANGIFMVTPSGVEATTGRAFFDIGLLFILVLFLAGSILLFIEFENLLARVGMIGISYLLLVAISFISWQMANDFLLSAPFLIEMFRIIFFVLIIMALPLLIGAFIWYFLMLWKVKEIERLMSKGMSYDEAERRQGRKYK